MKLTFKNISNTILILLIISIIVLLLGNKCDNEPKLTHSNKDSLYTIIAEKDQIIDYNTTYNKQLNVKIDSLKALKPKVIVRYKTVYDSLLVVDTMCIIALNTLHNEHTKIDSVNNSIITNQETHIMNDSQIIGNLTDIIAIQKHRIKTDSVDIEYLHLTVKKEKRKGKLKVIFGSVIASLSGFAIGSLR